MSKVHSIHIPVMGLGFTMDTPAKVAQYGIDSVISIGDDILIEKLRKAYCEKLKMPYEEIHTKIEDFRAKRITAYLNLMNDLVIKRFEELKDSTMESGTEMKKYFDMLPDTASLKKEFAELINKIPSIDDLKNWAKDNLSMGSIDVNIMTKVDQAHYDKNGEKLPIEHNDAFAGIRGFANSDLVSSLVFSAGMNPRLYGYAEEFDGFYPDKDGHIKKKIVLKVSDFRSAIIQGKFLAKKGLWVSEFRIESGLNCGGHAFATDGFLFGPILNEFKEKKEELKVEVFEILKTALEKKGRVIPNDVTLEITAQGGVGTSEEHEFLLDHYKVDSVGWGTPFLLVPEATLVDQLTMDKLAAAKEDDLYMSGISPLGIPFNSLRGNTKDLEKEAMIKNGRPGSPCPRRFLTYNTEFTDKPICAASRQYQKLKIKELDTLGLDENSYKEKFNKIVDKACLCVGLGTSAVMVTNAENTVEKEAVLVCPGPNMAYFSKEVSLDEMIGHIYGRNNIISRTDRPNMFVKELKLYVDYLKGKMEEAKENMDRKQEKYLTRFVANMKDGVNYYQNLFGNIKNKFTESKKQILSELDVSKKVLTLLSYEIDIMIAESKKEKELTNIVK